MGTTDDASLCRDVHSFNPKQLNDASSGCFLAKPKRCSSGSPIGNAELVDINE